MLFHYISGNKMNFIQVLKTFKSISIQHNLGLYPQFATKLLDNIPSTSYTTERIMFKAFLPDLELHFQVQIVKIMNKSCELSTFFARYLTCLGNQAIRAASSLNAVI